MKLRSDFKIFIEGPLEGIFFFEVDGLFIRKLYNEIHALKFPYFCESFQEFINNYLQIL